MSKSGESSPLPPMEANQVALRLELDAVRHNMDAMGSELKSEIRQLKSMMEVLTQNVSRLTTQGNPSQAGPSRPYVPPSPISPPSPPPPPSPQPPQNVQGAEVHSLAESSASIVHERRRRHEEDDDKGLKIELPEFEGSLNPDEYLDWVSGIERIFDFKGYSEGKKCRVAILKFKGYASLWWESVRKQRERDGKAPIREWGKLKRAMEKRFMPKEYMQELYHRLHTLKQEKRTVAEYIREFESVKIRCDIPEAREHTIARFIGGLHREIANVIELQQYKSLDDVYKLALKVEKQRAQAKLPSYKPYTRMEHGPKEAFKAS